MLNYLLVFLGGGMGSICRYGISHLLTPYRLTFPYATLIANIISCFILGMLVGMSMKGSINDHYKVLLMAGFCGGFSTFSTFSSETFLLFYNSNISYAFLNIIFSLLICIVCIYLGIRITS
ncbi:MAG: fluoride efflux transporter CrcB [Bacteroidetes bacterium]|nr:fluoride efflux transporter CrcB [Bacteroidota bacterium]